MGDHIVIMRDGEFVQMGPPEEIVMFPCNDYVRRFTEDVPRYQIQDVGSVMRDPGCVITADTSCIAAIELMIQANESTAYIVSEDGQAIAVRGQGELQAATVAGKASLSDLADTEVSPVLESQKLYSIINAVAKSVSPLAVVDSNGKLTGMVGKNEILLGLVGDGENAS